MKIERINKGNKNERSRFHLQNGRFVLDVNVWDNRGVLHANGQSDEVVDASAVMAHISMDEPIPEKYFPFMSV